jgi:hypothetical protein
LRLLGDDFELVRVDGRTEEGALSSETELLFKMELFCEYCHTSDTDSDDDESIEEMISQSYRRKQKQLGVDEDCDWETCSLDTGDENE